jgi:hypothetical protein
VVQNAYDITWHPGQENLADYQSKQHIGAHHQAVRPWYVDQENSPSVLPWDSKPSSLKGCFGTLPKGYVRNIPLSRVPRIQRATIPDYYEESYIVPMYDTPRSLIESAAYAFSPAWHAIAINT